MADRVEDYISSLEQRITALEQLINRIATKVSNQNSLSQGNNTARRVGISSDCFIDANGRAVLNNLELNNLSDVSSATYLLSILNGVVSAVPPSGLSGASLPIYSGDPDTDGTWKIHCDDGNFHVQCRISGVYYDQILQTPTNTEAF